jgi:hypothetical protein
MRVPKFHALYTWFFDCSFGALAELFVCAQLTPINWVGVVIKTCYRKYAVWKKADAESVQANMQVSIELED